MDFIIVGFVVLMVVAAAYTLYGRQRATGISSHPMEDRPGAPGAGEPRDPR